MCWTKCKDDIAPVYCHTTSTFVLVLLINIHMTHRLPLYSVFIHFKVLFHVSFLIFYLPSVYLGVMCVYSGPSSLHWSETDMIAFMILT